jgi:hypothetical protein
MEQGMATKRGNDEGTTYKRPNGKWPAQVTLRGHRLSHTFKTHHECQDWIKEILSQIDDGMLMPV